LDVPAEYLTGSTALGIAFEDAPAVAKAIADFAREAEVVKIKGGFLGSEHLSEKSVTRLATLPPLPVVRGQLLAMLVTPGTQLTRLLAEPGRQIAQVLKAFADSNDTPEPVEG
jgi:large subunit ribosomal protein L10